MRVIIPGVVFEDTFADNVAYTLRKMGHEVITPPPTTQSKYSSRWRGLVRSAKRKISAQIESPYEEWLIRETRDQKPDVLLALTHQISDEALHECRRLAIRHCVAWWGDPPSNLHGMPFFSPMWDALFFKDPATVRKYRILGANAHLLHEAMNPDWHKPVAGRDSEHIAIVGNAYNLRQQLIRKLVLSGFDVRLFGPEIPIWSFPEVRRAYQGRYVVGEEKSRVFGMAAACVNTSQLNEGNSLNCRAFEVAAAGGVQLMEDRSIISECFEPGREILTFASWEQLRELLDKVMRFPAEVEPLRRAAARRAALEHTYELRLKVILEMIAG
ncbi:MAG: CgeB family protein [Thermoanaerobaculia bacterium]